MKHEFLRYHPLVNFIYFCVVIGLGMFLMHPVFITISFVCSFSYSLILNGKRAARFNLLFMLPILLGTILINPIINHNGITILFYIKDSPVTYESIVYGITAALMFVSVIWWFSCYNFIMTSDRIIYLFGRIFPSISLILSMVLRLAPRYGVQAKNVSCAGRGIGFVGDSIYAKIKSGLRTVSIMTSWALENGITTADSMKSRGYGMRGRTSFSRYDIKMRDCIFLFLILLCTVVILVLMPSVSYFPYIDIGIKEGAVYSYVGYGVICSLPIILTVKEEINWKYTR